MTWRSFEVLVPGKWVLAGEHAVLRGQMAVALPLSDLGLRLRFDATPQGGLTVEPAEASAVVQEMLASIAELAGQLPSGRLRIESTIPVGAGLGSSAALCVAVTRWLSAPLNLHGEACLGFATQLEDRFHGKSSGMDVAAILAASPIRFKKGQKAEPISVLRLPCFTFHDTGRRASTRDCVARVEAISDLHRLDGLMGQAAHHAAEGLENYGAGDTLRGLQTLTTAMNLSHECFDAWGLLPTEAKKLRQDLLNRGALAAKLTGAGGGGFVVALWKS